MLQTRRVAAFKTVGKHTSSTIAHLDSSSSIHVLKLQEPMFGSTVNFKRSTNHSSYMRAAALMA